MDNEEENMEIEMIGDDDEIESDDGNETDDEGEVYIPNSKKPLAEGELFSVIQINLLIFCSSNQMRNLSATSQLTSCCILHQLALLASVLMSSKTNSAFVRLTRCRRSSSLVHRLLLHTSTTSLS